MPIGNKFQFGTTLLDNLGKLDNRDGLLIVTMVAQL